MILHFLLDHSSTQAKRVVCTLTPDKSRNCHIIELFKTAARASTNPQTHKLHDFFLKKKWYRAHDDANSIIAIRSITSIFHRGTTDLATGQPQSTGGGCGAHGEVREVVGEVRDVVEHVSEVTLLDFDEGGVIIVECHGGRVPQRAEVRVRVAGDPDARCRERQRRLPWRLLLVRPLRRGVVVRLHPHAQPGLRHRRRLLLLLLLLLGQDDVGRRHWRSLNSPRLSRSLAIELHCSAVDAWISRGGTKESDGEEQAWV